MKNLPAHDDREGVSSSYRDDYTQSIRTLDRIIRREWNYAITTYLSAPESSRSSSRDIAGVQFFSGAPTPRAPTHHAPTHRSNGGVAPFDRTSNGVTQRADTPHIEPRHTAPTHRAHARKPDLAHARRTYARTCTPHVRSKSYTYAGEKPAQSVWELERSLHKVYGSETGTYA